MFKKLFLLTAFLSVISLFSCSTATPLLTQAEMQKMSNEKYGEYFLKRMENTVIPVALESGGREVIKKYVQYGEMRVGSYPKGVDRQSPKFFKCQEEYKALKTELARRTSENTDENYYSKIMEKADKNYERQLDKMWQQIQNSLGQETRVNFSSLLSVDFIDIYENSKAKARSESFSLLDYTFEKFSFQK